mmetsp:Transcript_107226/g.245523  ORF Transcript_107226/g.245523 Transcript_107226/m.245523 type:complete len:352 (-) Transcript_107226:526-1581(-)
MQPPQQGQRHLLSTDVRVLESAPCDDGNANEVDYRSARRFQDLLMVVLGHCGDNVATREKDLMHEIPGVRLHQSFPLRGHRPLPLRLLISAQSTHRVDERHIFGVVKRAHSLLEDVHKNSPERMSAVVVGLRGGKLQRRIWSRIHGHLAGMLPGILEQPIVHGPIGALMFVENWLRSASLRIDLLSKLAVMHFESYRLASFLKKKLPNSTIESAAPHEELLVARNEKCEIPARFLLVRGGEPSRRRLGKRHVVHKWINCREQIRDSITPRRPPAAPTQSSLVPLVRQVHVRVGHQLNARPQVIRRRAQGLMKSKQQSEGHLFRLDFRMNECATRDDGAAEAGHAGKVSGNG